MGKDKNIGVGLGAHRGQTSEHAREIARGSFPTPELFSFAHDRRREELWGTLGQALSLFVVEVEVKSAYVPSGPLGQRLFHFL